MTHTVASPDRQQPGLITIFLVFGLLGPLVGALVMSMGLAIIGSAQTFSDGDVGEGLQLLLGGGVLMAIFAIPIGYMLGLPSALLTAGGVALWARKTGRVSVLAALVCAAIIGVAMAVLTGASMSSARGLAFWVPALLLAHLIAALACAGLARALAK